MPSIFATGLCMVGRSCETCQWRGTNIMKGPPKRWPKFTNVCVIFCSCEKERWWNVNFRSPLGSGLGVLNPMDFPIENAIFLEYVGVSPDSHLDWTPIYSKKLGNLWYKCASYINVVHHYITPVWISEQQLNCLKWLERLGSIEYRSPACSNNQGALMTANELKPLNLNSHSHWPQFHLTKYDKVKCSGSQ